MIPPKLLQSIEILSIPIADLQANVQAELEKNPFLELKETPGEPDRPAEDATGGE